MANNHQVSLQRHANAVSTTTMMTMMMNAMDGTSRDLRRRQESTAFQPPRPHRLLIESQQTQRLQQLRKLKKLQLRK